MTTVKNEKTSDETSTATTETTPPVPAPTPEKVTAKTEKQADDLAPEKEPNWLSMRLNQHERALLKQLGVTDMTEAKKIVEAHKEKTEAEKGEIQKLTEKVSRIPSLEAERDALASSVSEIAKEQMKGLSAEQRAAVRELAGDDAAKQIKTIRALSPTWAAQVAKSATETATEVVATPTAPAAPAAVPEKKVVPPPANTTPAPGTPTSAATPTVDHLKVLEFLDATNPVKSAMYYQQHRVAINAAREAARASGQRT